MEYKTGAIPLLSIVIPTRNRIPYVISAIESILEIPDARLEVVIQDNSDSRELESYVHSKIQDVRLRYRYTPPPFTMIDNFNAAVELATGEYLCMIGDDDGVNREIIEAASWAKANDLDALTPRNILNYLWKGSNISSTLFTKVKEGTLSIDEFSGEILEADVKKEVLKLLHNGGVYYQYFHFPKLYNGLVHRRCLDEVHAKTGAYFQGLSPDIFSVLAISEVTRKVVFIDYPLTIPGACPGSGSTYQRKKKFGGRIEDCFLFHNRSEYHWCELIPRIYSPETVWADSGVAALRAMGRGDLVKELNLPKLAAYSIATNPNIAVPVLRGLFDGMKIVGKSRTVAFIQFIWSFLLGPGVGFACRIWNRLQMLLGIKVIHKISGLDNMVEASRGLTRYLKENGYSFANCTQRKKK